MLRAETRMYQNSIKELENINQTIRDEHQGLQLVFTILEEKLRKTQVRFQFLYKNITVYLDDKSSLISAPVCLFLLIKLSSRHVSHIFKVKK